MKYFAFYMHVLIFKLYQLNIPKNQMCKMIYNNLFILFDELHYNS